MISALLQKVLEDLIIPRFLGPKLQKILQICVRRFVNSHPVKYFRDSSQRGYRLSQQFVDSPLKTHLSLFPIGDFKVTV